MTKAICVWYWFIFLPFVCPFLKNSRSTINQWLCKQNIIWLRRSVHKRKVETVQSDNIEYYPRSKLPYCRIIFFGCANAGFFTFSVTQCRARGSSTGINNTTHNSMSFLFNTLSMWYTGINIRRPVNTQKVNTLANDISTIQCVPVLHLQNHYTYTVIQV